MDSRLKLVAETGDINLLYTLIGVDPCLLDDLDSIPFVETPLHVAASLGHTRFAAEIMRLKPSFAEKPNQQGHTPLQVALQNMRIDTVHRLIAIDPQLICVKGREGMTPLHFVAQNGDIVLLNRFLSACPLSIVETTIRNETTLHIAVKNRRFDAFDVLMGRLRRALHKGSLDWELKILGIKDDDGNTVLHIAAQTNQPQVVKAVLDCRAAVKINEKNSEGVTALDISVSQFPAQNEMNKMLRRAGALPATSVADRNHHVNPKMSFSERYVITMIRQKMNMSDALVNVALVVMVLIATVTYQAALSPPGDDCQENNNNNATSTNISNSTHQPGFLMMKSLNAITFLATLMTILFLLPGDLVSRVLFAPVYLFLFSFGFSIPIILQSPWINVIGFSVCFIFELYYGRVVRKLSVFMIDQS